MTREQVEEFVRSESKRFGHELDEGATEAQLRKNGEVVFDFSQSSEGDISLYTKDVLEDGKTLICETYRAHENKDSIVSCTYISQDGLTMDKTIGPEKDEYDLCWQVQIDEDGKRTLYPLRSSEVGRTEPVTDREPINVSLKRGKQQAERSQHDQER